MQTSQKCEQCKTLNDASRVYCINCGKYLRGKVVEKEKRVTIWGVDETPAKVATKDVVNTSAQASARKVVICPECMTEATVVNNVMPLSCSICGYFFQAGIDKIVDAGMVPKVATKGKTQTDTGSVQPVHPVSDSNIKDGPMKRAANDNSSMRIIVVSSGSLLPEIMKETGNIIGKNGTVFKEFHSETQISIWHTAAGWYVRATMGTPLYNGVFMNQGVQIKLKSGDLLVIDQEQFMVEIF